MGNRHSRPNAPAPPRPRSLPASAPPSRPPSRPPSSQPSIPHPLSRPPSNASDTYTLSADDAPGAKAPQPESTTRKWRLTLKRLPGGTSPTIMAKALDSRPSEEDTGSDTAYEDADVPIPSAFSTLEKEYLAIAADYALARAALPRETEGYRIQLAGGLTLSREVHARHGVYAALLTKLRTRVEGANSWTMTARYLEHEASSADVHLSEIAAERGLAAAHLAVVQADEPAPPRDLASRLVDADKVIAYFSSQRRGLEKVLASEPRRYDLLLNLFTDKLQCSLGTVDNEVRALLQEATLASAVAGDPMVLPSAVYHAAFDQIRAGVQALEDEVRAYRVALKHAAMYRARARAAAQAPLVMLDDYERDIRFEVNAAKALLAPLRPASPPATIHNMGWRGIVVTP